MSLFWTESLANELLVFLTGRLKCPETAADLTHETYLRLYQSVKKDPPDNARALAFRIAVNLAIDYQRKIKVRNRHIDDVDLDISAENIADSSANQPIRILMAHQRLENLQIALSELPIECRTAFLLNSVQGLSYSEISVTMKISKMKVGRLLTKAIAHCALRLEEKQI
jgi:RNA polymerase sigma-70 factor (ECF subfamily)